MNEPPFMTYTNGGGLPQDLPMKGGLPQELGMKWNPRNLEIKTRSVERNLEPLVMQVRHYYEYYVLLMDFSKSIYLTALMYINKRFKYF